MGLRSTGVFPQDQVPLHLHPLQACDPCCNANSRCQDSLIYMGKATVFTSWSFLCNKRKSRQVKCWACSCLAVGHGRRVEATLESRLWQASINWSAVGLPFTHAALERGPEKWHPDSRILDTGRCRDVQECWVEQDCSVPTTPAGHRSEQQSRLNSFAAVVGGVP